MSTARTVGLGVLIALAAPLAVGIGAIGWIVLSFPAAQGERVRGPHDLVGVDAGGSYVWILPSHGGVVLVDAGLDPAGKAVLREIGSRKVHAVLLTHGHGDHAGGFAALPDDVPVYTADAALLRGERAPRGWLAQAFARLAEAPEVPKDLREVTDGDEIAIDGIRVKAITLPGHTDGSVAWLWDDVLFTGDALLGGSPPVLAPEALSDDPEQARESLSKLLPLDFDDIADGHVGLTGAARTGLHRMLSAKIELPTVSLRLEGGKGDPIVERIGTYVEAPAPDARGERPALVLVPDGPPLRVGDAPIPANATLIGKQVTVRGRLRGASGGEGVQMTVEELRPREDAAGAGDLPLDQQVGRWVHVRGTLRRFAPLQAGARWGEGELALPDGQVVALSAPVAAARGLAEFDGVVRVTEDGGRLRLVAASSAGVGASRPPPEEAP